MQKCSTKLKLTSVNLTTNCINLHVSSNIVIDVLTDLSAGCISFNPGGA